MSFDAQTLFELLPAVHRIRDSEQAARLPDLLNAAEQAELAALGVLPSPTEDEQERIATLQDKASRGPLESLIGIFAEQIGVGRDNGIGPRQITGIGVGIVLLLIGMAMAAKAPKTA